METKKKEIVPEVGMGVTMCYWSDRKAGTVVTIVNEKEIIIQQDRATRTDKNGMSESQEYSYAPDPDGPRKTFTLRKDGRWYQKGDPMGSTPVLSLGVRREYFDYSF